MMDILAPVASLIFHKWVLAMVLLGALIFVHEMGHFLLAKLFGVGVERFSFGFGPRIAGVEIGGTDYRLSWVPLGGYVKMKGDDPFEEDIAPTPDSFLAKPVWQRLLIMLAGPGFNLLLPILLFGGLYAWGIPQLSTLVGMMPQDSAAAQAGIQVGDRIVAVNGEPVKYYKDVSTRIRELPPGAVVDLRIERNGRTLDIDVPLKTLVPSGSPDAEPVNYLDFLPRSSRPYIEAERLPSAQGGETLRRGDRIVSINGHEVAWWYEVERLLREIRPAPIEVVVRRGDERHRAILEASSQPWVLPDASPTDAQTLVQAWEGHAGAPYGLLPPELFIETVYEGRPAKAAGIRPWDVIIAINSVPVWNWLDVKRLIETPADEVKRIVLLRGTQLVRIDVKPDIEYGQDLLGQPREEGRIGIGPPAVSEPDQIVMKLPPWQALKEGASETASVIGILGKILSRMVMGEIPLSKSIGGPISIVSAAAAAAERSMYDYFQIMALISVSLGIMNLLPIPLLDGGHILFLLFELIRGRPVSLRFREISYQVGLLLLLILVVFATVNDITQPLP